VFVKEEADVAVAGVGGDFPAVWGLVPDHVMLAEEAGVVDLGNGGFGLGRGLGLELTGEGGGKEEQGGESEELNGFFE